ncbi:(2Fe-2S)-binding protein [Ureibacillus chungkukjangi]|uniref:Carbon-monoxide dehydrogenase small subunit n=1 Tax=Ureibacillus chungkukjangi TaxID=1202712 RepID=A0A318TQD2_9BACL|nr:(2Fe-2S)-binding protein [Ureibacillus chungkukjangi]PYF05218.1 carbon-monoxide dehydrogenase small subunit [Ureibacillus chungkukjangi]
MDINNKVLDNPIDALMTITLTVNGEKIDIQTASTEKLVNILREQLNFVGTKISCGIGRCGACSVLIDNELVNACFVMAYQVNGKSITTIEGLGGVTVDEVQEAFLTEGGFQCGYCTSGMIMAVKYLLALNPNPSESDIKEALAGNLCRCTGYGGIIRSVQSLAAKKIGI